MKSDALAYLPFQQTQSFAEKQLLLTTIKLTTNSQH